MRKSYTVLIVFLLMVSIACLHNATNTYKVENNTVYDFIFSSVQDDDTATFKSEAGTNYTFFSETGVGVEIPDPEDFLTFFDDLYIELDDSLVLVKDIEAFDSWIHQYSGKSATHTLQIDSSDILIDISQ